MKYLIVMEMALLFFGNLSTYAKREGVGFLEAAATIGPRTSVGILLLLLILMLFADAGFDGAAALFGGMVVFSYLTESILYINEMVDSLLGV